MRLGKGPAHMIRGFYRLTLTYGSSVDFLLLLFFSPAILNAYGRRDGSTLRDYVEADCRAMVFALLRRQHTGWPALFLLTCIINFDLAVSSDFQAASLQARFFIDPNGSALSYHILFKKTKTKPKQNTRKKKKEYLLVYVPQSNTHKSGDVMNTASWFSDEKDYKMCKCLVSLQSQSSSF